MASTQLGPTAIATNPQELGPGETRFRPERNRTAAGPFHVGALYFVSSILVSEHAMWTITKMFEEGPREWQQWIGEIPLVLA